MKLSKLFMTTLREPPNEAEILSHRLMLRASLIRQIASGVYAYLPLGWRVIRKIEQIIREEMDNAGAQELLMSALISSETFKESGRWEIFGEEMFRLKDRNLREFCLGPTHEEVFTDTVRAGIHSYKSLPVTLYQIGTKFRDERRPRFGVIRAKEFIMKDAYSFDRDEAGLNLSYQAMFDAYRKIFDRMGLEYIIVDADSGAMGGSGSQEFMVVSDIGEDDIAYCPACSYAANFEKAPCGDASAMPAAADAQLQFIETPGIHTIEEVSDFFHCKAEKTAKTILYLADEKSVAVMVRGDREINETKLRNLLGCLELVLAPLETVEKLTGAQVGFAGPIGLKMPLYADYEVMSLESCVTGANKTGYHFTGCNAKRDFNNAVFADLRSATDGDHCPKCDKELVFKKGIEIGHIFKLGTKYTKALGCTCLNEQGKQFFPVMGCYGIGVSRLIAAVIEQNNDESGILWPLSVAPYQVIVAAVGAKGSASFELAEELYQNLLSHSIEALFDDRTESAGVKFKDADLIGIPVRITVGKKAADGVVELKFRNSPQVSEMNPAQAVDSIIEFIKN